MPAVDQYIECVLAAASICPLASRLERSHAADRILRIIVTGFEEPIKPGLLKRFAADGEDAGEVEAVGQAPPAAWAPAAVELVVATGRHKVILVAEAFAVLVDRGVELQVVEELDCPLSSLAGRGAAAGQAVADQHCDCRRGRVVGSEHRHREHKAEDEQPSQADDDLLGGFCPKPLAAEPQLKLLHKPLARFVGKRRARGRQLHIAELQRVVANPEQAPRFRDLSASLHCGSCGSLRGKYGSGGASCWRGAGALRHGFQAKSRPCVTVPPGPLY